MRLNVQRDFANAFCPTNFTITSLNPPVFHYPTHTVENWTVFYNCPAEASNTLPHGFNNSFRCYRENMRGITNLAFLVNETQLQSQKYNSLLACAIKVQLPVLRDVAEGMEGGLEALNYALMGGFDVEYFGDSRCIGCHDSGGICGSGVSNNSQFSCHCPDGTQDLTCPRHGDGNRTNVRIKVIIGIIGGIVGALLICIGICCYWIMSKNDDDVEAFMKNDGALALKRYKFSEVKKMTNSFKEKLGQGAFGSVYKGELVTGCFVAVKLLTDTKRKGKDFINEVASISRTSHVMLLPLLDFV